MPSAVRTGIRNAPIRSGLFLLLALLLPVGRAAFGQALPTAEAAPISTGFELPRTAGTLSYSVSANESLYSGYYGNSGLSTSTGLNGNLAFISISKLYPFSMVFSGGRAWSTSGQPSTLYLNLALSQVVTTRTWNFVLSDSVGYLPQTPSTGLSGIPGVGDLGVPPPQAGTDTGQGLLTVYSTRVNNSASLSAQHSLTGKTSIQVSGTYTTLRFLGNSSSNSNGVETTGESGTIGLSHRIDARDSLSGNYSYSNFSYGSTQPGFNSQTASMDYSRQFTRQLSMDIAAGPQWTSVSNGGQSPQVSINAYVSASLAYSVQLANFSVGYSRSTNSGFGVLDGARSDSVRFSASRTFDKVWNGSVTASYSRTTSLSSIGPASYAPSTEVVSAQISRAIARSLSTYASYTLENQSSSASTVGVNAFSGYFQVVGFGLTYSPTSIHVGSR
jgi:hypothetical protein